MDEEQNYTTNVPVYGGDEKSPFMIYGGDEKPNKTKISPSIQEFIKNQYNKSNKSVSGGDGIAEIFIKYFIYAFIIFLVVAVIYMYWPVISSYIGLNTNNNTNCNNVQKRSVSEKTMQLGYPKDDPYDYRCPDGEYIDKLYYNADDGLNSFSVRCNGSKINAPTSKIYGKNDSGTKGSMEFLDGINSMFVTAKKMIGNITPVSYGVSRPDFTQGGAAKNDWAGDTYLLNCPNGSNISGVYGTSGDYTNSLGFYCS